MNAGILAAIGACAAWGFVFVAPLLLPNHNTITLTLARYTAYGVFSLALWWLVISPEQRKQPASLWVESLILSLVGNVLYFGFLSLGLRYLSTPRIAVMTGSLPVIIAVVSNLVEKDAHIAWRKLFFPLALIAGGIAAVHAAEAQAAPVPTADLFLGLACGTAAVLAWTWYPIQNARCLRHYPEAKPLTISTLQGLTILPAVALLWALIELCAPPTWSASFQNQTSRFIAVTLLCGIIASGLGAWLWNEASSRLPAVLAGQLIVFETLFSLAYAYLIEQRWPNPSTWLGIALLVAGVCLGVRTCNPQPESKT
jgi:drug/metabolite transporter (DMT)-like permease